MWDRVPQLDHRSEEGVEVYISLFVLEYGTWRFSCLKSGGSVAWLKTFQCLNNVSKVVHCFVHHGDLVFSPSGFELLQLKSDDEGRGTR